MRDKSPSISSECQFGLCGRCKLGTCTHKCGHPARVAAKAQADAELQAARDKADRDPKIAILRYNGWARPKKDVKPKQLKHPYINHRVLFMAATSCAKDLPKVAALLEELANQELAADPLAAAAYAYNKAAATEQWKPGYLNMEKVTHPVLFKAAQVCRKQMPDISIVLRAHADKLKKEALANPPAPVAVEPAKAMAAAVPLDHDCKIAGCATSTGIDDSLTRGYGKLDFNGFWEHPCPKEANGQDASSPQA
jgi:hypothetical protein